MILMNYKQLGHNIREERKKQHLTIEELAYKADITPNYLGKIERAQTKLSLEVLIKISNALGLTSDDILAHEFDTIPSKTIYNLNQKINLLTNENADYIELLNLVIDFIASKQKKDSE